MTRKLKDELEPDNTSLTSPSTQLTPEEACVPTLPKLNCRILNYGPVVPLRDLKANYYGKYRLMFASYTCYAKNLSKFGI